MKTPKFLLAASFLMASFAATGKEAPEEAGTVLSWKEAVEEALQHNPTLVSSRLTVSQAEEGVTIADAGFLPDLNLSAGYSRGGSQALDTSSPSSSPYLGTAIGPETVSNGFQAGLQGSWKLFNGFSDLYARGQAMQDLARARAAYGQASASVRLSLSQAFNQLLYDQKNQDLLAAIAKRLHKDTRYLQLKYQSGQEARWTFLQAQSDEAAINWQLEQNKLNIGADRSSLGALLGRDGEKSSDLGVAGALEAPEPPQLPVLGSHPGLEAAQDAVKSAINALGARQASRWPSLSAGGSWTYSGDDSLPFNQHQWQASLSLGYNLFSGFSQEAAIRQADEALKSSQAALNNTLLQLQAGLAKAWASYRSAWQRLPVSKLAVEAGQERFKTVEKLYEAGRAAYLDYEQAESGFTQSQQQQLSSSLTAAQALASYNNALGLGLEDGAQESQP